MYKVKLSLEKDMKAQERNKGMLYSFFDLGAKVGWVVNATPRTLLLTYSMEQSPS
jgi:hypothetical protein